MDTNITDSAAVNSKTSSLRAKITLGAVGVVFACVTVLGWVLPSKDISVAERRPLAQMPAITAQSLLNGSFMTKFETYTQDQFPGRDQLRELKAAFGTYLLRQPTSHGIYVVEWSAAKAEYPVNTASVAHAAERFTYVWEKFAQPAGCTAYVSVIPDKSYFLAEAAGIPAMDYDQMVSLLKTGTSWATYVDIFPTLAVQDYYRTDPHWKNERLAATAAALASAMGHTLTWELTVHTASDVFRGSYASQSALPMDSDTLAYATNAELDACEAFNAEAGRPVKVFDEGKAGSIDAYDLFLGGPVSLVTITNPAITDGSHLIIFRDSFGSSIAPWLAEVYGTITLVDIRYMNAAVVGSFVDFTDADVLFLYSTSVLNHSETIK